MFVGVYVGLLVICGFLFALFGASVGDAVFEAASCLGNTGIGVGLLGRLEIFPLIFGLRWAARGVMEEARYAFRR